MERPDISLLNQIGDIFSRDLETSSWESCPKHTQANKNRETERKIQLIKVSKSKRRSGRRDRYHKRPHECVVDRHTDGDQNWLRIET